MNQIKKVSWEEIKLQVKAVNPSFYHVMKQIGSTNAPFFLAHYEFGEHFGIKNHAYLPTNSGTLEKIESKYTDPILFQHLGYGKNSLPLGMILDKYCEWHYFGENERIFPDCVQGPGTIFNMQIIFDEDKTVANNILSVSSGALSAFMLPNIGCSRKHGKIIKYFDVSLPAPKSPYEHYRIFKEILQNNKCKPNWHSQILYFSEQFLQEIKHNEKWLKLKLYFSENLRKKLTHNTYDAFCNDLFLSARKINRYRPTPYIIDTAKYIFNICMGSGIGVKPAIDDQYLPARDLQKIYHEYYGLEYTPTLMVPASLKQQNDIIYYPLLCPFAKINTFKTNQSNSTLTELEILKKVLLAYKEEFTDEYGDAFGSQLCQVSKETQFEFYHYKTTDINKIKHSADIINIDPRFLHSHCADETKFASDAKLFRGCVQLSR